MQSTWGLKIVEPSSVPTKFEFTCDGRTNDSCNSDEDQLDSIGLQKMVKPNKVNKDDWRQANVGSRGRPKKCTVNHLSGIICAEVTQYQT